MHSSKPALAAIASAEAERGRLLSSVHRKALLPRSVASSPIDIIPPILRPIVKAYILGYGSAVIPRLITLILQHLSRSRPAAWRRKGGRPSLSARSSTSSIISSTKKTPATANSGIPESTSSPEPVLESNSKLSEPSFLQSATCILRIGLEPQRFPTFCAVLVGGTILLQEPLGRIVNLATSAKHLSRFTRLRLIRWLSTFISAWLGLRLLQSKDLSRGPRYRGKDESQLTTPSIDSRRFAGRTLDLTLFAATRAIDVLVGELWSQRGTRRKAVGKWTMVEHAVSRLADPALFAISSGLIMWSWVYAPDRLPPSYNKWITSAASVDRRLVAALQRVRYRELVYGKETGQALLLGSMCTDYDLPVAWGDPVKSIPFPCELIHMGCGPSCEYHALSRFVRAWKWSMFTYLPLALALRLRRPSIKAVVAAFASASRSSAFLGMFIALFYYSICLGRTRLGPLVFGTSTEWRQRIDGGICIGSGCLMCGWSVFIETMGRRKDMALFVAPRALATITPRHYPLEKQWRETLAFAMSAAVVLTCVQENPNRVRGIFGRVLSSIMQQ